MIVQLKTRNLHTRTRSKKIPAWHKQYMGMLPAILRHADMAFRHLDAEAREEAVQEVVANTLSAFVRLVELGKADIAYAGPLANYAVAQVRDGRQVGTRLNVRDVASPRCQRLKHVKVERLDRYDRADEQWLEAVIEDRRTPPPDQAAFRIDFPQWLGLQSTRDRKVAEALALGETTGKVARRFQVSAARISQLRRELEASWHAFHGEPAAA